jgi:K+-transporting ATPase KdpF subunit
VTIENLIALIFSVAMAGYLIFAIVRAERF